MPPAAADLLDHERRQRAHQAEAQPAVGADSAAATRSGPPAFAQQQLLASMHDKRAESMTDARIKERIGDLVDDRYQEFCDE